MIRKSLPSRGIHYDADGNAEMRINGHRFEVRPARNGVAILLIDDVMHPMSEDQADVLGSLLRGRAPGERDAPPWKESAVMDHDIFEREFLGRPLPAKPSPGPWSVKEHVQRSRHGSRDVETTWVVLDANSKCVAECDSQINAIHIAQNGPDPAAERDGVTHGKGRK